MTTMTQAQTSGPGKQAQQQSTSYSGSGGLGLRDYQPPEGFFDEWHSANEADAALWEKLISQLEKLGSDGLQQRNAQSARLIRDNGITYNVLGEDEPSNRLWQMDLMPVLVSSKEHEALEVALSQRMHLLNLILQDIYGRQHLLRGGKYPAQLVMGNPAFLRPVHHLVPAKRRFLNLFTADLARSPDGNWWVLSDRVDAASGLGYALENRYITTSVLPDIFRSMNVRRLADFMRQFTEAISLLAPRQVESPQAVLLTPGPWNETYFEQIFLARMLGFPLVEGADLTVRENKVFLKTTSGMEQVHVILRRLDSDWCDPLELRSDSLLGVPGLLNAIRQGNVSVANMPGCSVVETPALMAFLPTLCRSLLGEELKLPSVATWWCGQKRERQYVLENLEKLVVKPTFRTRQNRHAAFGPALSKAEREVLAARIKATPEAFTAQEMVLQATTPVLEDTSLRPRHFLIRWFMARAGEGAPFLMPGGLGRIASSHLTTDMSMQSGGSSKDVWVAKTSQTRETGRTLASRLKRPPESVVRPVDSLPSRMADNLFWLGRYIERTDGLLRGLVVAFRALQESRSEDDLGSILPILEGMTPPETLTRIRKTHPEASNYEIAEHIMLDMVKNPANASSLCTNLRSLQRTTHAVRERICGNVTKLLQGLPMMETFVASHQSARFDEALHEQLLLMLESLAAFSGTIAENTTRGQDWHFLNLGRRIERSIALIDVLFDCMVPTVATEDFLLPNLLNFADCTITYRRRYLTNLWPVGVMDLLVSDPTNPRSLAFQAQEIRSSIQLLPHHRHDAMHPIDRQSLALFSTVNLAYPQELAAANETGEREQLRGFLQTALGQLYAISDLINSHYFSITAKAP